MYYKILLLYIFSMIYLMKEFFRKYFKLYKTKEELSKHPDRVAVITGGTMGIGLATVEKLLSLETHVIIGSNFSVEENACLLNRLKEKYPTCKVKIMYLDLSSMTSVQNFAVKFQQLGLPLHLLINNGGIMYDPFKLTEDGFESHFAINYLSHCLLVKLLLPCLKQSSSNNHWARIVNVASCVHYVADINFDDLHGRNQYCKYNAYIQSKLAIVMFTKELHEYLMKNGYQISVNSLHPGVVYSKLYKNVWWAPYLGPLLFKTCEEGAETTLYAALSSKLEGISGCYLEDCNITSPSLYSQSKDLCDKLWNQTWELLKPWESPPVYDTSREL